MTSDIKTVHIYDTKSSEYLANISKEHPHKTLKYFAENLIDFDFAANNGGWQWAASTGCDAQPWFRIFNPILQSEKFDPEGKFIKRYLPALEPLNKKQIHAPWISFEKEPLNFPILLGKDYPNPIVSHKDQREKALKMYDLKNVA